MKKEVIFAEPVIASIDDKLYRIHRIGSCGAIADFKCITTTRDYGWVPVRNGMIRERLAQKIRTENVFGGLQ